MARISGIDLPREKRIEIALTYIYGIGPARAAKVLELTKIDPDTRVKVMYSLVWWVDACFAKSVGFLGFGAIFCCVCICCFVLLVVFCVLWYVGVGSRWSALGEMNV